MNAEISKKEYEELKNLCAERGLNIDDFSKHDFIFDTLKRLKEIESKLQLL